MKKIISTLLVSLFLISCSKSQNNIKSEISVFFENNAKDPKSYEFVELKIADTVTVEDCIKSSQENNAEFILYLKTNIEDYKTTIIKKETDINEIKNMEYASASEKEKLIADLNKSIENKKKQIESLNLKITETKNESEKIEKIENKKDVVCFVYKHKYRLKNGFGALDLVESYFLFDKNNKLLNKSEDILEIYSNAKQEFREIFLK
jgi:hypothetical protein